MRRTWCVGLLALAAVGCATEEQPKDAGGPPLIDECQGLPALTLSVSPSKLRVQEVALLRASGGSGRYSYAPEPGGSGGEVRGDRFVAGSTPGLDRLVASDDCGNSAGAELEVQAAFSVAPVRATVRPGTSFQLRVSGMIGAPEFRLQNSPSHGTLSPSGVYTAGPLEGLDLLVVRDSESGEEALLQYQVAASAAFQGAPEHIGLPAGATVPLRTRDGSDARTWMKLSGPGTIAGDLFSAPAEAEGVAVLQALDTFTGERATVTVHVMEELGREGRPHGRLSDVAAIVTGDFDGDGIEDVALGVPESSLGRAAGGAVFIFKGAASGLSAEPTYVLKGGSATGSLGAVLAAGDLDGDGRDDLAVSEPGADVTAADSGAVLLYRFGANGPEPMRAPLTGLGRGNFGASLAIADVDADGDGDLLIGSPGGDLARSAQLDARGVVDLFVSEKGGSISDFGMLRIGGSDLAADGSVRAARDLRFGSSLAVADFNGDGRADLASLGTVRGLPIAGSGQPRAQAAVALHFGRASSPVFAERPDLYILPSDGVDGSEGTWRLTVAPGKTPRLLLSADQLDSPDLSGAGGVKSGSNAGGVYLYELSDRPASEQPPELPPRLGRDDAVARVWGDAANGRAGRSVAFADLDRDGSLELVLGAPYADYDPTPQDGAGTLRMAGRLLVFSYASLTAGARLNKPAATRGGGAIADALGVALSAWSPTAEVGGLLAYAGRATTRFGDFTGRLDAYLGRGTIAELAATQVELPARATAERHGQALQLGVIDGRVHTLLGMPGYAGHGAGGDGNDLGAGRALAYAGDEPARVVHQGAERSHANGGRLAFGGRSVGTDVSLTDFDGDGRAEYVVAAPLLSTPTAASSGEFAQLSAACTTSSAQTNGGAFVYSVRPDGTVVEAFRLFAPAAIAGCTPADAAACKRSNLARDGLVGGFDFDGDGKQDLLLTRANGLELFLGRAPLDPASVRPTAVCEPLFSLPALAQGVSAPAALGDLDGDGCDEVAVRYADNARSGLLLLFGYDASGMRCAGHGQPSWLRISGDGESGLNNMQLGIASARAGRVLGDERDFVAISAGLFPFEGVPQPTLLLFDSAQLAAARPEMGEAVVPALGALMPMALVHRERAPGFGRSVAGNVDIDGDGQVDLLVSAPGASINGDGVGAVFAYRGGASMRGRLDPWLTIVGDQRERGSVGQDLSVVGATLGTPLTIAVGVPLSDRTGAANGTSFLLALPR